MRTLADVATQETIPFYASDGDLVISDSKASKKRRPKFDEKIDYS